MATTLIEGFNELSESRSCLAIAPDDSFALVGQFGEDGNHIGKVDLTDDANTVTFVAKSGLFGEGEGSEKEIVIAPDGSFALIVAYPGGKLLRVNLETNEVADIQVAVNVDNLVMGGDAVKISSDGSFALFPTDEGNIGRVDLRTNTVVAVINTSIICEDRLGPFAISPDTSIALFASGQDIGRVDLQTNKVNFVWSSKRSVTDLAFSPDGTCALFTDRRDFSPLSDSHVGRIDLRNFPNSDRVTYVASAEDCNTVSFSPDGTFALVTGDGRFGRIDDPQNNPSTSFLVDKALRGQCSLKISQSGDLALYVCGDKVGRIDNLRVSAQAAGFASSESGAKSPLCADDGRRQELSATNHFLCRVPAVLAEINSRHPGMALVAMQKPPQGFNFDGPAIKVTTLAALNDLASALPNLWSVETLDLEEMLDEGGDGEDLRMAGYYGGSDCPLQKLLSSILDLDSDHCLKDLVFDGFKTDCWDERFGGEDLSYVDKEVPAVFELRSLLLNKHVNLGRRLAAHRIRSSGNVGGSDMLEVAQSIFPNVAKLLPKTRNLERLVLDAPENRMRNELPVWVGDSDPDADPDDFHDLVIRAYGNVWCDEYDEGFVGSASDFAALAEAVESLPAEHPLVCISLVGQIFFPHARAPLSPPLFNKSSDESRRRIVLNALQKTLDSEDARCRVYRAVVARNTQREAEEAKKKADGDDDDADEEPSGKRQKTEGSSSASAPAPAPAFSFGGFGGFGAAAAPAPDHPASAAKLLADSCSEVGRLKAKIASITAALGGGK